MNYIIAIDDVGLMCKNETFDRLIYDSISEAEFKNFNRIRFSSFKYAKEWASTAITAVYFKYEIIKEQNESLYNILDLNKNDFLNLEKYYGKVCFNFINNRWMSYIPRVIKG